MHMYVYKVPQSPFYYSPYSLCEGPKGYVRYFLKPL